ncbi:MAG: EscU/YscU/HrcU family type III secretion system export apparatus switch protein [Calditrichia bacterium]
MKTAKKLPQAVALRYRQSLDSSPVVTAKGQGPIARRILQKAEESGVAVLRDPQLSEMLMNLEINDPIPEKAFSALAEIYAFLIETDDRYAAVFK